MTAAPRAAQEDDEGHIAHEGDLGIYFPLLFERYPIPLFVYDWDTLGILLVNDAALAQYGYRRDAFLKLKVSDLMGERDQAEEYRADVVLNVGHRPHRKSDGTTYYVDILRHRLTIAGRTLALVACPDASARVEAEAQLRRSTEELRLSHDNLARAQRIASTGSVERDFATKTTTWSDETYRIFGVERSSFTPSPEAMLTLIHPEDRDMVADSLKKAAQGEPVQLQYRIVRPDGTTRVLFREAEVICDAAGNAVRSVSTLRDITRGWEAQQRQKRLEDELRLAKDKAEALAREAEALAREVLDANLALEHRVEERTIALRAAQDALLKKERMATLGQLTATVAHELRNPLSAIKNTAFVMAELTSQHGLDVSRPLTRIQRSIERCNRIISDLLDYSRTRDPECTPRRLDDWLKETMEDVTVPPAVAVAYDLQAGAQLVGLDGERFRQVLINLVENAVQAMTENGELGRPARLCLSSRIAGETAELAIADNGPGIAAETLARVFEPLFSTKSFGTGLGLATAKHIVEQHGGRIEIASTLGEGTKVVLTLPLLAKARAA